MGIHKLILIFIVLFLGAQIGYSHAGSPEETVNRYLLVPEIFYDLINNGASEEVVKVRLIDEYNKILTNSALAKMTSWIDETSIHGEDYTDFFSDIRLLSGKEPLRIEFLSGEKVVLVYAIKTESVYSMSENIQDIGGFVREYNIENYAQDDLNEIFLTHPTPELIELRVTKNKEIEFCVSLSDKRWLIKNIESKTIVSQLKIDYP